MILSGLDAALISQFGESIEYTPFGSSDGPEDVRVIRRDPDALSATNVLMVLFGTMEDSGFSQMPAKNDLFDVGGQQYRAYDVQGPDANGGIHIYLDK